MSGLALRIATIGVFLAGFVAIGRIPVGEPPEHASLRVALRMLASKVSICESLSPEELASLPAHMRLEKRCRDQILPYRLRLAIDGEERLNRVYRPSGASGDRPVFVHEELALPPSRVRVRVVFAPDPAALASANLAPDDRKALDEAFARSVSYELDRDVTAGIGEVVLVGLDESAGSLTLATPGSG